MTKYGRQPGTLDEKLAEDNQALTELAREFQAEYKIPGNDEENSIADIDTRCFEEYVRYGNCQVCETISL